MKKKLVILSSVLLLIVCVMVFLLQPTAIVKDTTTFRINSISYNGENITDQINCDELVSMVSNYSRSKLPNSFAPYQTSLVKIEINATANHQPLHILLGDINVAYISADKGGYTIYNGEHLLNGILKIIS